MSMVKKASKILLNLKIGRKISRTPSDENDLIAGIVFSKDRPMQLFGLLESYFKYCHDPRKLFVLYKATDEKFSKAYDEIKREEAFPGVVFVEEQSFKHDFLKILTSMNEKYVFFLVDDNMFKSYFSFSDFLSLENRDSYLFSLRLGNHISFSYTRQTSQSLPAFRRVENFLCWKLKFPFNDWNYAFSVDGNIYIRKEIEIMSESIDFKAPNSFEARMNTFKLIFRKKAGLCYPESKVVNVCLNKVQDEVENIAGEHSVEELIALWNDGKKMDINAFQEIENQAAHIEVEIIPLLPR